MGNNEGGCILYPGLLRFLLDGDAVTSGHAMLSSHFNVSTNGDVVRVCLQRSCGGRSAQVSPSPLLEC